MDGVTYSVTNARGTFSAGTVTKAKKLAAEAAAKAEREKADGVAAYEEATERAYANGFRIMRNHFYATEKGKQVSAVYDFVPADHRAFKSLIEPDTADETGRCGTVKTAAGDFHWNFGHRVIGCVMSGSGYPLAVVTQSESTGEEFVAAFGSCRGKCATVTVPGLSSKNFVRMPEE